MKSISYLVYIAIISAMANIKKILNLTKEKSDKVLTYLLIIMIIISFIILVFNPNFSLNSTEDPQAEVENFSDAEINILDFSTEQEAILNDRKVIIPSNWRYFTGYRNYEESDFKCLTTQIPCSIFPVYDGEMTAYLSTPNYVSLKTDIEIPGTLTKLTTATGEVEFIFITLEVSRDNPDDPTSSPIALSPINKEIKGCLTNEICVSSGLLSLDIETNKKQTEKFVDLVSKIIIE